MTSYLKTRLALLSAVIAFSDIPLGYLTFDQGRSYLAAKHEELCEQGEVKVMPPIDADAHVIESERTWDYIGNDKLRPFLITPGGSRPQNWLIDGRVFNRGVNVDRGLPEAIREMRDIEGRLKHMDELEIDVQVLYPSLFLRPLTAKAEVERAICRSYNQWLIDICNKAEGRLRWIAVVPVIDMASAVEEVRFAKANGAC